MKAAILTESGFEIREFENPVYQNDELLIKITACGVCSGDVFVYQNRQEMAKTYPRLGHEASGVVAGVGEIVQGFSEGDLVTTFGVPAYAEYLVTTPNMVVKLPVGVDPVFALGEAIACCVHAGDRFGTQPGDRVAIVGCGFMGLVCQQLARYQGAEFVVAIDPLEDRRELAKILGADVTIHPGEQDADAILAQYDEFDIVIEAVGNQSALDLCTPLVKKHGRIILIGYHQSNQGMRAVNMEQWNYKAIDVVNGHVRHLDEKAVAMQTGMELMQQGFILTEPLVTVYDFKGIERAFRNLSSLTPGLLKVVLRMST